MSVATSPGQIAQIPPVPVRRFSVPEYHQMIRSGVFLDGDPFELLEGWIVSKMTRSPRHDLAIELLQQVFRHQLPTGWRVRIQSAITTPDSEPEPDFAVVRGPIPRQLNRHPEPPEIGLVVEVAESSLAQDRDIKSVIYARAGIQIYWIINLIDSRVEVFADPTGPDPAPKYRRRQDYGRADTVPLVLDGQTIAQIAVRDVLP